MKKIYNEENIYNAADGNYTREACQKEVKSAIAEWERVGKPKTTMVECECVLHPFKTKEGKLAFSAYCYECDKEAFETFKKYAEELPEIELFDISKMNEEDYDGEIFVNDWYYIYTNIKF